MAAPTIVLLNYATVSFGCTIQEMATALQAYCDGSIAPAWGVSCKVEVMDPPPPAADMEAATAGKWPLLIVDDSKIADAEGWHEVGPNGEPRGFAAIKTTIADGDNPQETIGHEFAEMLVDPWCARTAPGPNRLIWESVEICDAVEATGFLIAGILMSNFILPAWFMRHPPAGARFDLLGVLKAPFSIGHGGYISEWRWPHGWSERFGSDKAHKRFLARKTHKWSRHSRRMRHTN